MGILDNFTAKLFGKRSAVGYEGKFEIEVPVIGYGYDLSKCSPAADAVRRVASAVANTEAVSHSGDEVVDTAAVMLINTPNDKTTGDEMAYKIVEDLYKGGKSYVVLVGNVISAPLEMHYVHGAKVSEMYNSNGDLDYIRVSSSEYAGTYRYDDKNRLVNVNNPLNQLVAIRHPSGKSVLNDLGLEIMVLSGGLKRNAAMQENGGRTNTLVTFKDSPTEEEFRARLSSINTQIARKQYGGILGTTGETEIKEFGLTPRDMDYSQLQATCREQIYIACGVPLPLVSNDASSYNNVSTSSELFYTDTVIPLANLIYSTLGREISKREGKEYTTLTDENKIAVIQRMKTAAAKARKELGAETVNETRAMLGLPPVENGDAMLIESRYVPLDSLGAEI